MARDAESFSLAAGGHLTIAPCSVDCCAFTWRATAVRLRLRDLRRRPRAPRVPPRSRTAWAAARSPSASATWAWAPRSRPRAAQAVLVLRAFPPPALRRSFSACTSASSLWCASWRARFRGRPASRRSACGGPGDGRGAPRRSLPGSKRPRPAELAHLAANVEHVRRRLLAGAAGDAAVGVEHGAVDRDDRDVAVECTDGHRRRDVVDDDGVIADDGHHQHLVLGRRVAGHARPTGALGELCLLARDVGGVARDDRGAPFFADARVREERTPTSGSSTTTSSRVRAEEAGERVGERGRRLDTIRRETDQGLALRLDEGLRTGADALAACASR